MNSEPKRHNKKKRSLLERLYQRSLGSRAVDYLPPTEEERGEPAADLYIKHVGSTAAIAITIEHTKGGLVAIEDLLMPPIGSARILRSRTEERSGNRCYADRSVYIDPARITEGGDAVSTGLCHIVEHGVERSPSGHLSSYMRYIGQRPVVEAFQMGEDEEDIELPEELEVATLTPYHLPEPYPFTQKPDSTIGRAEQHYESLLACVADGRSGQ